MASLNSMYMKLETLKTLVSTLEKKNEKGIELTISINDEPNQFGQNLSSFVAQSKEDREAKKDRFWTGNGKTFWTDGAIKVPPKEDQQAAPVTSDSDKDDLPF
jgi:hypothetical protein